MRQMTATPAARGFADMRGAVHPRGESLMIVCRGRPLAVIPPAPPSRHDAILRFLDAGPPDHQWAADLREIRAPRPEYESPGRTDP